MGWASGWRLMADIITTAKKHIPDDATRQSFYADAIKAFRDHDCDTLDECRKVDPAYDAALRVFYPPDGYELGYEACNDGVGYNSCPFPEGHYERGDWHQGYKDATLDIARKMEKTTP